MTAPHYGPKDCAACGKTTACVGRRYNSSFSIRRLCDRSECRRSRKNMCRLCSVLIKDNRTACYVCDPPARARKVSTEDKAARGDLPDSGPIPGASTSDDFDVLSEDVADLRDEVKKLRAEVKILNDSVNDLIAAGAYKVPMPNIVFPSSSTSYDKTWY